MKHRWIAAASRPAACRVVASLAVALVGPHVRSGFRSTMAHQHQDTLRTILQALRVSDLPNAASSANTLGDMLQ